MAATKTKQRPPAAGIGRKKGVPNKLTKSVKDAIAEAFNELQGDPNANLTAWARRNTTEFYKVAAKLIPAELHAHVHGELDLGVLNREPKA
jgi:hypothetical protein